MKKLVLGLAVCCGVASAMSNFEAHSDIIENHGCLDVVALKEFDGMRQHSSNLHIERCAYDYLLKLSGMCTFAMSKGAKFDKQSFPIEEVQNSVDISSIEVSLGDCAYLSALAAIFSGKETMVDEHSLENILFAAKQGCKDAQNAIKLACYDISYDQAISKGINRAKSCLRNRILGTEYDFEFYQPLAIDFPLMIASYSDWSEPLRHVFSNISYLKKNGNVTYAYAAVQDFCGLYTRLVSQYETHLTDDSNEFLRNLALFLSVASRLLKSLDKEELASNFEKLSKSVEQKERNCIADAQQLFANAFTALKNYDDEDCND